MAERTKHDGTTNVEATSGDAPLKKDEKDFKPTKPMATPQDKTSPTLLSPGLLEHDAGRLEELHRKYPPEPQRPALDPTPLKNAPTVITSGHPIHDGTKRPSTAHMVDAPAPEDVLGVKDVEREKE